MQNITAESMTQKSLVPLTTLADKYISAVEYRLKAYTEDPTITSVDVRCMSRLHFEIIKYEFEQRGFKVTKGFILNEIKISWKVSK